MTTAYKPEIYLYKYIDNVKNITPDIQFLVFTNSSVLVGEYENPVRTDVINIKGFTVEEDLKQWLKTQPVGDSQFTIVKISPVKISTQVIINIDVEH